MVSFIFSFQFLLGLFCLRILHLYKQGALGDHNYCRGRRFISRPNCYYKAELGNFALSVCDVPACLGKILKIR